MDEETSGSIRLTSPLRPLLTYGVPYIGAGVWAFAKFPDRLRWTNDVFARVFGLAAPFFEDLTHVEGYGEALDAAIEALERPPARVLDLCCGTGFAARQVQHHFPDADVVGIDLSPEMVLMARREADEEGLDIEFEVGDAGDLEFDDESFDLAVSHNAPPHPEETMRVLGPGGIALTVWSFGGPWIGLAWPALAKRFRKAGALHADGHRAGPGFYGIAEKSGVRRRRRSRMDRSGPDGQSEARGARTSARGSPSTRAASPVPPPPPVQSPPAPTRTPKPAAKASSAKSAPPTKNAAGRTSAAKAPAAKASSARAPAAKTTAGRTPAAKARAAKAPSAKAPGGRTSAAKPPAAKAAADAGKGAGRRARAATPPDVSPG
jgi:SAM-dependent methyltransferase